MDWQQILAILVPLLCAIVSSPVVIHWFQRIELVRRYQLEDNVERWVRIACSYAEAWAENKRKSDPDLAIASSEKLALARDVVRSGVSAPLDDREIDARIEHELIERTIRDLMLKIEAAGGRQAASIEKTAEVVTP